MFAKCLYNPYFLWYTTEYALENGVLQPAVVHGRTCSLQYLKTAVLAACGGSRQDLKTAVLAACCGLQQDLKTAVLAACGGSR